MHEMSVALEVCSIAERHAPGGQLADVVGVGVEVGCDSGVEASNLEFWLQILLSSPPYKAAKPVVTQVPGGDLRVTYLEVVDGRPDN
ncbi:MAG: hypothetical protein GTO22_17455 [Gemmatimonadales bacterium]|nr:hypothetical protein [Gemmatimonadales bacterium]